MPGQARVPGDPRLADRQPSLGRAPVALAHADADLREVLLPDEVEQRVENGQQVVSANFVTPYPPGYPVLVPGQVFSAEILSFMRSLDTPEVHGYRPGLGYRVYVDKALEIAAPTGT
jgi:arginine decarboxylase